LQGLLADPNIHLTANDIVAVDSGTIRGSAIINDEDSGAAYVGSPGGNDLVNDRYRFLVEQRERQLVLQASLRRQRHRHRLLGDSSNNLIRNDTFTQLATGILISEQRVPATRLLMISSPISGRRSRSPATLPTILSPPFRLLARERGYASIAIKRI